MKIAEQSRFDVAQLKVKNHDTMLLPSYSIFANRLITLGYVAIAIVAVAVLCFASSGPGVTEAELATATVLP
jgi:hypothetical protein